MKSKGFDSPDPPYVEFPSTSFGVQYVKRLAEANPKGYVKPVKIDTYFFM